MTPEQIWAAQVEILKRVLRDSSLKIDRKTTAQDVEGWDSLAHIQIVSEIEAAFKVRFGLGELHVLRNVGDMTDLITKKLAQA